MQNHFFIELPKIILSKFPNLELLACKIEMKINFIILLISWAWFVCFYLLPVVNATTFLFLQNDTLIVLILCKTQSIYSKVCAFYKFN